MYIGYWILAGIDKATYVYVALLFYLIIEQKLYNFR